jgi:hypothetical protein
MNTGERYTQARADFEYLERLAELDDQVELDAQRTNLMRNPTKLHAAKMYEAGVRMWFQEHHDRFTDDRRVCEIKERSL